MTELLTSAQMRAVEAAAMARGEVTGLELMERAGRGVVEAIFAQWPELGETGQAEAGALPRTPGYLRTENGQRRAVVLCGPGNNGGDGFVIARMLRELDWGVEVFLYGDPLRLPPDARVNFDRWSAMGVVRQAEDLPGFCEGIRPGEIDLCIDAIFGTGLTRPIPTCFQRVLASCFCGEFADRLVSVDIPSGLCADSGRVLIGDQRGDLGDAFDPLVTGCVACPDLLVTFHRNKLGCVLADGGHLFGRQVICDIGLAEDATGAAVHEIGLPLPSVWDKAGLAQHKYSYGHALVLSGPQGQGGAARLAARGALRIGAGLVTVACPPEALSEHAARLDAVMLRAVADGDALVRVLADKRINALCLGPGMGTGGREAELIEAALAGEARERPLVLDADALTMLAREAALFRALHRGCVLTPHAGEFARLFPDLAERLNAPATSGPAYSKVDATREAAARAGCVVLYKGGDTVIADPSGRCAVHAAHRDRAAPWLATAGSGDVLAGFITGLLARGVPGFDAACAAAWLHVECALHFGPGLIAEDLPEQLPAVFRQLQMK